MKHCITQLTKQVFPKVPHSSTHGNRMQLSEKRVDLARARSRRAYVHYAHAYVDLARSVRTGGVRSYVGLARSTKVN